MSSSENPYRPSHSSLETEESVKRRSRKNCIFVGWLLFTALPLALGVFVLVADARAMAALPPGVGRCGMDAVTGFMLIGVAPIFGLLGCVVGAAAYSIGSAVTLR